MCELLGMSANVPTDICFSFTGFLHRGGGTGPHRDGWGIAFYEEGGYRDFRDPHPSVHSPIARLITDYPIKSNIVISHIRQANVGQVRLANTHPFVREMWGSPWCYAHNGQLEGWRELPLTFYRPVGDTDSEHAFCWLLNALRRRFSKPPRAATFWRYVHQLALELSALGTFNFLLSDGRHLGAFCSTHLTWLTRQAPFGEAELVDEDLRVDFSLHTQPTDVVTVVATRPLTRNEVWTTMAAGSMVVFAEGRPWLQFGGS